MRIARCLDSVHASSSSNCGKKGESKFLVGVHTSFANGTGPSASGMTAEFESHQPLVLIAFTHRKSMKENNAVFEQRHKPGNDESQGAL